MKDGVTLYFVRHGQTDWNFARRMQGQIDIDLNDTGRTQAVQNGRSLKKLRSDIADLTYVASPLNRCRETMEIIRAEVGLPREGYTIDERLKEIHFGTWQGLLWQDLNEIDPVGVAARNADPYAWRPEGGESYADLMARIGQWLATVECDMVVVSHGGVSRALRGHILDIDPVEMTELRVPQDKVLILRKGEMAWG